MSVVDTNGIKSSYNRSKIFKDAHFAARGRQFNNRSISYAELFADCLKLEYARARQRAEWAAKAAARQAAREDELLNGLPIASCAYDLAAKRRSYAIRTTRAVAAIGA